MFHCAPGPYTASEIDFPLDSHQVLILSPRDDHEDWSNLARPTVLGTGFKTSMHPDHSLFDEIDLPSPYG